MPCAFRLFLLSRRSKNISTSKVYPTTFGKKRNVASNDVGLSSYTIT